jgi:hypothetical protein
MAQIEIKITIPDHEYENWDEYREDGIDMVKMSIKKQISDRLKQDYVRSFEIDVTHEP